MADGDACLLKEDGYLYVKAECKSIIYHPNLNVLLITTASGQVYVFDVNFGVILQRSSLSGKSDGKLQGVYLAEGVDKVLYTDGRGIGVRSDYNGVLLLDTILQTPVARGEDIIKMEILLSEAILLNQCLRLISPPGVEHVKQVVQELSSQIHIAQGMQKKGVKAQKWNTICLELPHATLKLVCSGLVAELKKLNKHIPALPIASAINERLNGLLRGLTFEGGPADRALMFSEAARRETFSTWPHMNYKWALPGQMAQAGFYHEPNPTANDRAMCFTCNVCLVCWEPTDEPWSEHERHLPTCPFVKGEHTQNVPLSVTLATAPARESSESVDVIGTTNVPGLVATASHKGLVTVWNISNQLKSEVSFCVASRSQEANNKESIQFFAARNLTSAFLSNLSTESDPLVEYEAPTSQAVKLTALALVRGPKSQVDEGKTSAGSTIVQSSMITPETSESKIRPCLVCGLTLTTSNSSNLRTLENVWAASTDLAPSSSLVRAMNSVNSAASDSLDIMKVAGDRSNIVKNHYLVLYDFHHKAPCPQTSKEDSASKTGKTKKTVSGTGTTASSNGGRQESLYQDMYMSKFLYEVPVIEDVDCEMVGGTHFDGIFQTATLPTSSTNSLYHSASFGMPQSPFDANFNPINTTEQFPSTSDISAMNKKTLDRTKSTKNDLVVLQSVCIEAPPALRISYIGTTKDGRHLYVSLVEDGDRASEDNSATATTTATTTTTTTPTTTTTTKTTTNANQMDVDEESEIFSSKRLERMYWDQNGASLDAKLINGEIHNEEEEEEEEVAQAASAATTTASHAILLAYALDFSGKVVKLVPEPIVRRDFPAAQAPLEHVFLPLQEKHRAANACDDAAGVQVSQEPKGRVCLVCKDGVVRILNLATLKTLTEARPNERTLKYVSAAYCNGLERLCVCSSDGDLNFFRTSEEDDLTEEKDDADDVNMMTEAASTIAGAASEVPGTSSSSAAYQEPILAHRPNLTYNDLRDIYELTRFDRHSPAYGATVPSCWNEMMQAQRQRRHPQHLHQSEDQHHTRTWRLQNDMTTWDEHIFELTLPRSAAGCIGHVDVRFILHWPCLEIPIIQVTLLKQKMAGLGHHKSPLTPVDDRIDFSLEDEENGENPVISEEYQRQHNTEILCGPINLQRCTDLSDHSGCVTLTSPKLFSTKARTLLVHIKALADPVKDSATSKSKVNLLETKPPILKKLRIDEAGPLLPGATVERLAAGANKKLEAYIGCDWIHELSITVRSVQPTNIPNERLQRCAMLESTLFIENLLKVACLQGADKTLVAQSLALDILIWVVAIRLTRLRVGQSTTETKAMQLDTVRCVQGRLNPLLRTCLLHAGRSVAHKCVKLIILCSEGLHNTDDPAPHSFDEAVLSVLVALLPSIVSVQWAGSLRWLALLITRLLPLDRNHAVAQQCVAIVQQISAEMSNRVNPYHLLLATRFGLYNTPFETELFDIEPPMPPKSSSMPVTYATILTGEQSSTSAGTTTSNACTQDMIDLRDLLTLPAYSSGELIVPSKLKALCTNHSMKGLLEVEPLHFTCHAASDGTKMEKIDSGANVANMGTTLFDTGVTTNNVISEFKTVQHTPYNLDAGSLLPDLQAKFKGKLSDLLSQCTAELAKKPAAQLSITPDDQSDSDEPNNMTGDNQIWHGEQNDTSNSHALASTVTKEKSTIANIGAGAHKVEDNSVKKREDVSFPWGRLLCWPPQQALVVERMHSGARRFVVLDFGSPILLTDLMIPSCSDLVSLSIDIWTKNEEIDGTRLVVAGDIGTKPLVVNDLQPPPVCRYLKITTIGRYGMSTTRCRIPLGMFYGHMVGLPGEDYSEPHGSQTNTIGNSESTLQATIDTQCSILSALAEDVQCRFSLATERLKTLLDPLLCTETPNVMHMQHYLNRTKSHAENKEQPSTKILSTYQECILFQHQLNVVRGVWRRLESWRGCKVVPSVSLASASSDKLRVLGETLLDILLYTVYEIGPVPSLPASLCDVFTPSICEAFFHSVCVVTPAPRLQLHAAAFLARMAGHQPWWGNFLANTLVNLYSTSSTCIFPQDRVFILLTFLGRKSLIAGANKSSVVDAMVRTLGRLLAPISNDQTSSASNSLDTTLIGWVLLFLSVCLDTTAQQLPCLEDNSEKSKEQGVASRWEFLQGESAMQRKYVSASRYSASRSYRRKLQKRLMHHKQQLQDLEQAKKVFQTSSQAQAWGSMPSQVSTLSNKLEAALKSQERFFKKTLRQHTSKHFKDIISIRRNEVHLPRGNRSHPQSSSSRPESLEIDFDCMANLSHQHVLPVARGLVALILNNAANVDMFLLACKVVARLVVSTRPAISLGELMTEEQLVRLVKLATGISDSAWSSHAVACLLQDLLEGGRLFPRPFQGQDVNQSEEVFEPLGAEGGRMGDDDLAAMAGTSGGGSTALGNDEGFAEGDGDEDTQDSTVPPQATASTSKSNGFNLASVVESDDSEFEDFLDDILERGKNTLKKGTVSKLPTAATSGISLAIDARLEYGIETGVEISLRRLSTLGVYNLPLSINATVQIPVDVNRSAQPSPRNSAWLERNQEMWSAQDTPSSLSMLTRCFDKLFTDLLLQQNSSTSLELVLQLWLSLNLDASLEQSSSTTQFDPSLTPVIPLSSAAISGLISALLWHPGVSLRAWCLALQTLTLASNEPLPSDHVDPSISTPLDGLLGGMASCVVKDRNIGPMFLRLLSGNGLNVESRDKQYMMAGPRVALALQDFLVRLETRCDVILPGSSLGNALKKLLLWVVYQLVQPGGALVARRGPLDAQCILINSLISLSFTNTDLGTAMSISECVGVLVSTYIRGARVGAECGGIADSSNQTGNFGGLFSCVLGGGSKQGRPTSWEILVVALIKLVCRLVQTPLPNARFPPTSDSIIDMELGEACQRPGTSSSDDQAKLNISQTDESKVAEQQTSMRQQQTTAPKPRYPCVADTVLQHEPTMMRLLGALGYSAGFCFTMLFDGDEPELRDPASIPDATFELLSTLMKKATSPQLVLNPLYRYLASSCGQSDPDRQMGVMQLSEPLLWYILKVLDNEESVGIFTGMGGVKVLCENLVNNGSMSSGLSSPGVIALVMQHLSNAPNLAANASSSSKKTINNLESGKDNLLNFAPLGTVSWVKPMVEPADVLVQSSAPHRRARTAAWSYQFFPGEFWVDLTITLPCAILLKEVELQPHLSSLATCPSAVALEISREGNSDLTPVCPPMPTAGLTSIHLTLSQPEVATSVLVRLYKPRDCTNISLSQIKILGTTAFGEIKSHNETIAEEQLTKTSFGWLRLVHQCLSVSNLSSNLAHDVLSSAAGVEGLIEACCSLLLLRPRSLYTPDLERVLLQLGLHSRELGLQLINLLLNNRCTPLFHGTSTSRKSSTAQLVVELLQQLCLAQDSNTEARVSAVLSWLRASAESALTRPSNTPNVVCPPAVYVHCAASIVWKAHEHRELSYNLESLLPDELFDSLYEWTLTLRMHSALKLAIDAALCSLCYVRPSLFPLLLQKVRILVPNLATDRSASISDDRKDSEGQTDDRKSETDAEEWYCRLVLPEHKRLELTESQLLTVAAAAKSPTGIQQLIDSGLPSMLSATITEFCKLEKSKQYGGTSLDDDRIPSTSNTSMTDSDKAGEAANQTRNNTGGLCMTEPDSIAVVLEFLSLICSEGRMRDWLGTEGRDFWLPLVSLLSNRPIENPSVPALRMNVAYSSLESAMIKFLSRCCWCHPNNQKLLSELLTNVILQQRTSPNVRYLHGISGFTRRLILQLLLEGEKVLVSVTSETPMTAANSTLSYNTPSMPPHPADPHGHYHHLLYMSTQSTVADVLQQVSGTWLLLRLSNSGKGSDTSASGTPSSRRDAWETGTALMVDTLSVAAGNTAKDKRAKEASNRSQARGPTLRKARLNLDATPSTSKSPNSAQPNSTNSGNQQYLTHSSPPNLPLPPQLTIAQLLAIAEDNGASLSDPILHLTLKEHSKDSKEEAPKLNDSELLNYRHIEGALGVFSAAGGLAVLAKHLPLVYPDSGRPPPSMEKSPSPEQPDADWVKVEVSDDTYVDLVEAGMSNSPRATPPAPHVPFHSLAAFGLFLRLPGYAEVLLGDRKQAQCLLRLALGVTDDGEGGDILSSPIASSLPTLPFQVLKQLLESTPPTTDDGLLLRRTTIEVGAVLLLLNCLAIFTHQTGHNEGTDQRGVGQTGGRSDDKSHLYWAKGTGFGTGSTQQSWNVEQALLRQRSEEEHVTVLLQVLASYVGSGGQPQRDLPVPFTDLLARSCLLPALSSYLRNDSVLDMARHIPLYRAILQLLRAMALSSQLAPLLMPRGVRPNDASIVSLLYTMRMCVDAYVYKINRSRGNKSRTPVTKYPEDTEQDEGLATLIPDIQESATIVQNATSRLNVIGEELAGPSPTGPELPLRSVEQRYLEVMKKLQFDTFEIIADNTECSGYKFAVSYHFESNMRTAGERNHPARVKRLAQEAVTLSHALPLSYSSSVFVRCDAERLDIMKVLITGPAETPYANGCFEFDVYFPPDYPNSPMMINLETTGRQSVRFNPNLYNDGKVCLSVLNTWHGRPEEKWNAHTSSFLQVLVSIQSLILVPEPYFNEPGYERSRGTPLGAQSSQEYNANICQATVKWAMLDQIKNPCPCFKEVIHTHFWIKRHEIIAQLQAWIMEMELHGSDRRCSRISINAFALRRYFRLLREELNKLPTPEGLEDLAEPLASPGSPLELSGISGTPSSPPSNGGISSSTTMITSSGNPSSSNNAAVVVQPPSNPSAASNHVHHDIDTDVEMEKMVSKVCE